MSREPITIPKNPVLDPAEDFYRLRRDAIGAIEQLASQLWTDYNKCDSGITTLETLCYAITDLASRYGWDIKDILAPASVPADTSMPYGKQAFFTVRRILTVNPVTVDDFRHLLLDLAQVRNAWLQCKTCACETDYYAWCDADRLHLSYQKSDSTAIQVHALGLYDVLLELEAVPGLGDLNSRKIEHKTAILDQKGRHPVILELRFPDIELDRRDEWERFLDSNDAFAHENGKSISIQLNSLGATRDYDLLSDAGLDAAGRDAYLRRHWNGIFYANLTITINPSAETIFFEYATLRFFGGAGTKAATTVKQVQDWLQDTVTAGLIQRYRHKAIATHEAILSAKAELQAHRNLDEDYCNVKVAGVEEVAVCADVEVRADADIEWVQANIWLKIEQYFNVPIPFYSLKELIEANVPVEDIFNGPALNSGFIKAADLQAAELKSWLRVSDIVNELMDIDGVVAVNHLQLSKYDAEGNVVAGAADPVWVDGIPSFDPAKVSASWLLHIDTQCQPRLYMNFSRFLFFKNGLPFLPRMDEAADTLTQLRGEAERPKYPGTEQDLPIPLGRYRDPADYTPVQYGFPLIYGIGPHGLSSSASNLRKAQARQMKAYLMVFEQLLGNAHAQLAHTADLFSLDPGIARTYFVKTFAEPTTDPLANNTIVGFDDIDNGLTQPALEAITETRAEFLARRNRFLDHLLARFAEQFDDYALVLTRSAASKQQALERLIGDKTAFLSAYPLSSHDRARAFDYTQAWPYPDPGSDILNEPGIKARIGLLLGIPDLLLVWTVTPQAGKFRFDYILRDPNGKVWFGGTLVLNDNDKAVARHTLLSRMGEVTNFHIVSDGAPNSPPYRLKLMENSVVLGQCPDVNDTTTAAALLRDELVAWAAHQRAIVVEHLLLRPKFPGDALYPACSDGDCKICGEEDPYSFRLTYVMPGWSAPYSDDLEMRRFAERTVKQETPSHLLPKICWVGNEELVVNPCAEIIDRLADTIVESNAAITSEQACDCANKINTEFHSIFEAWYEQNTPDTIVPGAIANLFNDKQKIKDALNDTNCAAMLDAAWDKIREMMISHFQEAGVRGLQFDRFEDAWQRWQKANVQIDWMEERLQARVEAVLHKQLSPGPDAKQAVCECAVSLLSQYGVAFFEWMQENVRQNNLRQFNTFSPSLTGCAGLTLSSATLTAVMNMLHQRYEKYAAVSYRLWIVLERLAALRNIYPGATLHDCDEGNDETPVSLDSTALGNYKLRKPGT